MHFEVCIAQASPFEFNQFFEQELWSEFIITFSQEAFQGSTKVLGKEVVDQTKVTQHRQTKGLTRFVVKLRSSKGLTRFFVILSWFFVIVFVFFECSSCLFVSLQFLVIKRSVGPLELCDSTKHASNMASHRNNGVEWCHGWKASHWKVGSTKACCCLGCHLLLYICYGGKGTWESLEGKKGVMASWACI